MAQLPIMLYLLTRNYLRMFISGLTIDPQKFCEITPPPPSGVSKADYLRGYLNAVLAKEFVSIEPYTQEGFTWTFTFSVTETGEMLTLKVRLA